MEKEPLKILELKFTVLEFYSGFVVSTVFDDQVLDQSQIEEMRKICHEFYSGNRFVYISNRTASYNVNPIIYLDLNKSLLLAGIGVVTKNPFAIDIANFEKKFSKLPFEVFLEMREAKEWAEDLVKNKKADL